MFVYLSTTNADRTGPNAIPRENNATIHELSSGVIGRGESSANSLGSVGDDQPNDEHPAAIISVPKFIVTVDRK